MSGGDPPVCARQIRRHAQSRREPSGDALYLDNQRSSGPNSAAGRFAGKGLNENLAREILELHTLGAEGGYSQDDVTALARILTG